MRLREGDVPCVQKSAEHLLFRAPVRVESGATVAVFLHITNRNVKRFISLVLITPSTGESRVLERVDGNIIHLLADTPVLLVARVFSSDDHLPAFTWRLTVASLGPVPDWPAPSLEMPPQRYTGFYSSNNRLKLFRERILIDKSFLPLAFRVGVAGISVQSAQQSAVAALSDDLLSLLRDACFIVRVYRKTDKYLLREVCARGLAPHPAS